MQCSFDFSHIPVVVTGASGGIGAVIAAEFARAGADVALVYRKNKAAAERSKADVARFGTQTALFAADLTKEEEVKALFAGIAKMFGIPRVLINCAGLYPVRPLRATAEAEWHRILDSNLTAAYLCTREFARSLQEGSGGSQAEPKSRTASPAGAPETGAAVVNIASVDAARPFPGHAHYSAAKSGLLGLTRGAALEYGPHIRINAVSPGLVSREGIEQEWPAGVKAYQRAAPLNRIGEPGDIAHACLFLASDSASWITGIELVADGGVSVSAGWLPGE